RVVDLGAADRDPPGRDQPRGGGAAALRPGRRAAPGAGDVVDLGRQDALVGGLAPDHRGQEAPAAVPEDPVSGVVLPTTLFDVRDAVCRWFGGAYDPETRSYRDPQVRNLGAVRRARPKREDDADYFLGAPAYGALMGSQMWVHIDAGTEKRLAVAGPYGLKEVTSAVVQIGRASCRGRGETGASADSLG